ncbi:MAG: penicillin-binding protein 2 [Bifidobacteriaceae bacterium]|jgi:peptidoglycan glycosyltransferase|nr:penicillin-binding protein 2 [Bifidobacteriaceae bacterium]
MNREIRRITLVAAAMLVALLVATTTIQFGVAADLRADPRNARTFYDSIGRDRGVIMAQGGTIIARSEKSGDAYVYQRIYSDGPLYASITGYATVVGPPTGLELAENEVLLGTADSLFSVWVRLENLFTGTVPTGGAVEVTIVPAVQQAAWDALGDNHGSAVVLDAKTGEILALVSKPAFDPNTLASHDPEAVQQAYNAYESDPSKPLNNRAIAGDLYFPGSTFKLVTAAAALESGDFEPDSELSAPTALDLPGTSHKLTNYGDSSCSAASTMTMADALAISCNTAFGWLGLELGAAAIANQAERFGFGEDQLIPLYVRPSVFPSDVDQSQTALGAIGQFNDRVTPLQMAMVVAAIANGGRLMEPHLVRSERDDDLKVVTEVSPAELSRPLNQTNANALRDMMIQTATAGTGRQAQVDAVTVGAKTGTAEKAAGQAPDVWTVAFGEVEARTVAVALVIEDGGSRGSSATGGSVAAPAVASILRAVFG